MRWQRTHRKGTRQPVLFSTLGQNERRRVPWLGNWAQNPDNTERLKQFCEQYDAETVRLLAENPSLKLI